MVGLLHSNCRIPCITTTTSVRKIASSKHRKNTTDVYLLFNTDVETTLVTLDRFEFVESLNFLGSYLGLWPGMGLFQVSCHWLRAGHMTPCLFLIGLFQLLEGLVGVMVMYRVADKIRKVFKSEQ